LIKAIRNTNCMGEKNVTETFFHGRITFFSCEKSFH